MIHILYSKMQGKIYKNEFQNSNHLLFVNNFVLLFVMRLEIATSLLSSEQCRSLVKEKSMFKWILKQINNEISVQ